MVSRRWFSSSMLIFVRERSSRGIFSDLSDLEHDHCEPGPKRKPRRETPMEEEKEEGEFATRR